VVEHVPEDYGVDDGVFWREVCGRVAVEVVWVIEVGHREPWSLGIVYDADILFVEKSVLGDVS